MAPRWTAESQRDFAQEAPRVIQAMRISPGMSVADVGAGDGYYVMRLAEHVGSKGRVFGQDIVPDYLELLRARVEKARLRNVVVVEGAPHDPRLPADSLDAAILIHMYHEISDPYALLWNLAGSLKAGGRVGILDTTSPTDQHGTPLPTLHCELGNVGYVKDRVVEMAEGEYLAIYRAPARAGRPTPSAVRSAAARGC